MNIINLIALIVVPILAVIIGQKLQDRAQKRNDKIQIFKILMMSRIYGWTTESVQAMNLIEIVFADDDTVCKQWKVYYDKLCVENPTETELQKIKKEELTDIRSIKLDPSVPQDLRAVYVLKEMGNPYCFRVGDLGVKLEFPDSAPSLQDALSDFFQRKKSGL